eukprot:5830066-Pleurochrysis_carterae.AAC.1
MLRTRAWCASACVLRAHARRVGAKGRRAPTHAACACATRVCMSAAYAATRDAPGQRDDARAHTLCAHGACTGMLYAHTWREEGGLLTGAQVCCARLRYAHLHARCVRRRDASGRRDSARARTSRAPARRACARVVRAHAW